MSQETNSEPSPPPVLRHTSFFFDFITIGALIIFTVITLLNNPDTYFFLVPVILYGLFYIIFPRLYYRRGQPLRIERIWILQDIGFKRRFIFIATGFCLFFLMYWYYSN